MISERNNLVHKPAVCVQPNPHEGVLCFFALGILDCVRMCMHAGVCVCFWPGCLCTGGAGWGVGGGGGV